MKAYLLAAAALLAGCSDRNIIATVTRADIDLALKLCEPNGTLMEASRQAQCRGRGCSWTYTLHARCTNGATFSKEMTP